MKLTITNNNPNPTTIWLRGGGLHEIQPGKTAEDLDIEDGQAGAYASQAGLTVKGYKAPTTTDGRKTDHKQADAAETRRAEEAEEKVQTLLADLAAVTAERDALAATIADLGEQDVADDDDADDLRKQAIGLGIKVDKRWTDETVQRKIDEKLAS